MELKDRLVYYFRSKKNKYVVLSNGSEVKLAHVKITNENISLIFNHDYNNIKIEFNFFTDKLTIMEIPEDYYENTQIRVESMNHVGFMINEILRNWTERKDEIDLEWRD